MKRKHENDETWMNENAAMKNQKKNIYIIMH